MFKKHYLSTAVLVLLLTCSGAFSQAAESSFNRPSDTRLRLVCYNARFSSVFPLDDGSAPVDQPDRRAGFARIVNALDADIWSMQEVLYTDAERIGRSAQGILQHFEDITSKDWHIAADLRGRVIFSRYPVLWKDQVILRVFVSLIDLPDSVSNRNLLLVDVHLKWNDADQRLVEARALAQFLKKVKAGEVDQVSPDDIILVTGDFNSTSDSFPYRTICSIDTDVAETGAYNQVLYDPKPSQWGTDRKETLGSVFFDDNSWDIKGKTIDFLLLEPGPLAFNNTYILNTLIMDTEDLQKHGLEKMDVALYPDQVTGESCEVPFDHLPIIADFSLTTEK